ncbi:predicted protein [Histoplasma capsulatum var. duboisii H88]|uniref:Predicted protein n=1 Tax=Ajellomyces capsulatus (strain H88) TaxID=544711 RepID=F0UDQ6_AJEC8|nr:predicted protein [Histoplasma capsulatum var. duboisii H88]
MMLATSLHLGDGLCDLVLCSPPANGIPRKKSKPLACGREMWRNRETTWRRRAAGDLQKFFTGTAVQGVSRHTMRPEHATRPTDALSVCLGPEELDTGQQTT